MSNTAFNPLQLLLQAFLQSFKKAARFVRKRNKKSMTRQGEIVKGNANFFLSCLVTFLLWASIWLTLWNVAAGFFSYQRSHFG